MTLSRDEAEALATLVEQRYLHWTRAEVAALVRHMATGASLDAQPFTRAIVTEARQVAASNDRQRRTLHQAKLVADGHCMADCDGDCTWDGCTQNNPATRQPHCPRDIATRKRLDPDDEGRAGG